MGKNNKSTENYMQYIWVKNIVILGWFPFLAGYRAKGTVLLFWAFLNYIDRKQQ